MVSAVEAGPKAKAKAADKAQAGVDAAVKAIEKLGGTVERLDADPEKPVVAVVLTAIRLTPEQLGVLSEFPDLHTLILRESPLDNAGLEQLEGLPNLRALDLEHTKVNDAGLASLKKMPMIKEVFLTGSGVTLLGVETIQKQMPQTQIHWLPPLPRQTTAAGWFKLGEDLNAKHERVQAIRAYTEAMKMDPKLSAAHLARGWALLKEDEHLLARADFETFVKLQPQSAIGLGGLALAYYLTGDLEQARATAEKSLKVDKNCADGLYVRGMVSYDSQDFDAALPDFERAVVLEPADAANHERLGWTYLELRMHEKSLTEFNAALKLDPQFEHAYYGRGLYWMAMRKPAQAIPDLTQAFQIDPSFPDYAVDLALAHATMGDWALAVATQKKVLAIAAAESQADQQQRLKLYMAKRLPPAEVESAAKPGTAKK